MRHYQGLVWYQRGFAAPAARKGRYFLRFGAANYSTVAYVNGKPLGRHEGGFTPFAFEVTGLLRDGDNQVTIGVDSQATAATVPPPGTDAAPVFSGLAPGGTPAGPYTSPIRSRMLGFRAALPGCQR